MDTPYTPHVGEKAHYWGQPFRWTIHHPSLDTLKELKLSYDELADVCLEKLHEIRKGIVDDDHSRDLFVLLKENAADDPKLRELWEQVNYIPEWVDWAQIARGQEVFYRYGLANLSALPFLSLIGGMGAGRIAEVLVKTGGFSTKMARRRLLETTQYVLQVTNSLESIKPEGDGHAASVRVRLLHAAVRRHVIGASRKNDGKLDEHQQHETPVNDLDTILTICAFSTIIIYIGLPRQGIWLTEQEIADYNALWRLVAHYLGTPTDPFETAPKARAWMEALLMSEVQPNPTSALLADSILASLDGQYPLFASRKFMEALVQWMTTPELVQALGLKRSSAYYQVLVVGYCVFIMTFAFIQRVFSGRDQERISIRRRMYWNLVMHNKLGLGDKSQFEFKYSGKESLDSTMGLLDSMDLKTGKRGIETCARVGLMMIGFYTFIMLLLTLILRLVSSMLMARLSGSHAV